MLGRVRHRRARTGRAAHRRGRAERVFARPEPRASSSGRAGQSLASPVQSRARLRQARAACLSSPGQARQSRPSPCQSHVRHRRARAMLRLLRAGRLGTPVSSGAFAMWPLGFAMFLPCLCHVNRSPLPCGRSALPCFCHVFAMLTARLCHVFAMFLQCCR